MFSKAFRNSPVAGSISTEKDGRFLDVNAGVPPHVRIRARRCDWQDSERFGYLGGSSSSAVR